MLDFGMRNDDEFYNKMKSSTAVSTKTALRIAMDGVCKGGDGVSRGGVDVHDDVRMGISSRW